MAIIIGNVVAVGTDGLTYPPRHGKSIRHKINIKGFFIFWGRDYAAIILLPIKSGQCLHCLEAKSLLPIKRS